MVDLADDLLIAGVGAVLSGGAAIFGAWIGAKSTRQATTRSFELAAAQEDAGWREALRRECEINLTRWGDLDSKSPNWSFDSSVLADSTRHARAFSPEVFQRIISVKTNNDKVEETLISAKAGLMVAINDLPRLRVQTHAEIQELFNALNAASRPAVTEAPRRRTRILRYFSH
jgi:hypothetical protein